MYFSEAISAETVILKMYMSVLSLFHDSKFIFGKWVPLYRIEGWLEILTDVAEINIPVVSLHQF